MFEKRIKPILQYVGAIGATITCIAYMIIIVIIVIGFDSHDLTQSLIFATINAIIGFIIMQLLKIQGISFAKNTEENKKIIKEYYSTKTKDKKLKNLKSYIITSTIKDILFKGLGILITTCGFVYIAVKGNQDYMLILLAIANLFMFICFGLLSLNSAYDFYNNYHVPYMIDKINNRDKLTKGDINKCLKSMEKNLETSKNKY